MTNRLTDIYNQVLAANDRICSLVVKTPLNHCSILSQMSGAAVYLKCEQLQHTGSFKCRGALSKLTSLIIEKQPGKSSIITASTGNHGLAVAYAAKQLGISATVYLPKSTPSIKQNNVRALGAKVVLINGDGLQAEKEARCFSEKQGQAYISPYNDMAVIAGQGTIGYELYQQMNNIDALFVSVGGGGLISGIAGYLKSINSKTKIIGCWPKNANAMLQCLNAGKIIEIREEPTLSTSTAGGIEENSITFPFCQTLIDDYVCVSEKEISKGIRLMAEHEGWLVEGAAGVALASFMKVSPFYKGLNVAVLLCGRNIGPSQIKEVFCEIQ